MSLTYPARVMLAAAMNPCACGYLGRSGPSLPLRSDRRRALPLPGVGAAARPDRHPPRGAGRRLSRPGRRARRGAERRHPGAGGAAPARSSGTASGTSGVHANAHMGARDLRRHCRLSAPVESLLREAVNRLGLSARAYHRVLKIARTIADLDAAAGADHGCTSAKPSSTEPGSPADGGVADRQVRMEGGLRRNLQLGDGALH